MSTVKFLFRRMIGGYTPMTAKEIGERIKKRRVELGLTQTYIKETTGISSGNMSDIERGNRFPSIPTLIQLCSILNCTSDYILTGSSPTSEKKGEQDISVSISYLIELFSSLSNDDVDDLIALAEVKLSRSKRREKQLLSPSSESKDLKTDIA